MTKTTKADIAALTGIKPYPFKSGLIVHVNTFTHKIDSGYLIENGKKIGRTLTPAAVISALAIRPDTPVSFTKV